MTRALYPGTFDPITNGHLDIIRRGAQLFEAVDVVVAVNARKQSLFTLEERLDMVRACTRDLPGVNVISHSGLMVECLRERKAQVLLRGLRAVSDFEYEFQMALMNKKLDPACETMYLMPSEKYTYLASSLVRELAAHGADISEFVPPEIETLLRRKLGGKSSS
ncbi:MAG TPA: pantetheine-phosphate adenylyltransferase [Fibrobacteria bacterium]|nr:pantetheine-phosphate adenylyltransferase [Fibrobacteria bacterium]